MTGLATFNHLPRAVAEPIVSGARSARERKLTAALIAARRRVLAAASARPAASNGETPLARAMIRARRGR